MPKLTDFDQDTIALLRLVYLAPGLERRMYARKAEFRPLFDAKLIEERDNRIVITEGGKSFMWEYMLDHFGFQSPRHHNVYPAQLANNEALMRRMMAFTGHYIE
jgi:hypothetical protein